MARTGQLLGGSLLAVAVAASPALAETREPLYPIPKTLTMTTGTLPYWADVSVAFTANGEPDPAIFGFWTARVWEILETPADNPIYLKGKIIRYQGTGYPEEPGCRNVGPTYQDYPEPPPRDSLENALSHNEIAMLGRVTGKAYGFSGPAPGQLLQVQPIQAYGLPLSQPRYYFFVPLGRLQAGRVTICALDNRYSQPPEVGDEVFLFVSRPVDPAGVLLHVMDAGDVVPVNTDGSLRLPRQYEANNGGVARPATPRTKSEVLARLDALRAQGATTRSSHVRAMATTRSSRMSWVTTSASQTSRTSPTARTSCRS